MDEVSYFPGAIKVSVSTANITASQILSHYALCQGLPSNALDYQSLSAPTSPPVGTDRAGLRVTILITTTAIFALPFCFGRYPVLIRYSLSVPGIPPHPLTAIPASYGG